MVQKYLYVSPYFSSRNNSVSVHQELSSSFLLLFFFCGAGVESRALCVLHGLSCTEPHLSPHSYRLQWVQVPQCVQPTVCAQCLGSFEILCVPSLRNCPSVCLGFGCVSSVLWSRLAQPKGKRICGFLFDISLCSSPAER